MPFAQYGNKAILVLDKEQPDPAAVVGLLVVTLGRQAQPGRQCRLSRLREDRGLDRRATRSLKRLTEAKKFLTVGRKGVDDAGAHLEAMKEEIKVRLDELKAEIDKAA